jgi:hypothetical protein
MCLCTLKEAVRGFFVVGNDATGESLISITRGQEYKMLY